MYMGAQSALADENNPERLCCAAHELRELMEKVHEIADVRVQAGRERMKPKALELQMAFDLAIKKSSLRPPSWDGTVDVPVANLLEKLREFVEWLRTHSPRRKDEVRKMLRALDGQGGVLPPDLEAEALRLWDTMKEFFQDVAHHQQNPTQEQFEAQMVRLEDFLLRKLNPRTFADFDALDTIMAEGELDDQR